MNKPSVISVSAAQLEFVQILVIVVVMMVMVVVITCLLNHYRLSARSLLSRHAPTRRRHQPLANVSEAPDVILCASVLRCGEEIIRSVLQQQRWRRRRRCAFSILPLVDDSA